MTAPEEVLNWARLRGYNLFPVGVNSKAPAIAGGGGFQSATTDLNQIREWWKDNNYNVGIRCGRVSNLTVIDIDGEVGKASAQQLVGLIPQDTLRVKTPNGTHIYLQYVPELLSAVGILPGIDIRNDETYVVAPPSIVEGKAYEIKNPEAKVKTLFTVPDVLIRHEKGSGDTPKRSTEEEPNWITKEYSGVTEGYRDDAAAALAGFLHNKHIQSDIIETLLTPFANNCTPPYPIEDLRKTIKSVSRYPTSASVQSDMASDVFNETEETRNLSGSIRSWIENHSSAWFTIRELDQELGITAANDKHTRRQALRRLKEARRIEQHQKVNERWRKIDIELVPLDFTRKQHATIMNIHWPLGIEDLVNIYPGNIVCVAGAPNSGKTALLLNVIRLNQDRFPIYYWCSEMGEQELQARMELFDMPLTNWSMQPFVRATDFHEVIKPDAINIIDFMELTETPYIVNDLLTKLNQVIGKGVVIVALQKKIGALLGRGAEYSLEKPRLYLSLDAGKITIVKGKNWAQRNYDPSGLERLFSIEGGAYFIPSTGWQSSNQK